jgi:hypothetical protein
MPENGRNEFNAMAIENKGCYRPFAWALFFDADCRA